MWADDDQVDSDPIDAEGYDDADEDDTLPCPACGRQVYEDADQCPYCGEWIIPLRGRGGLPSWARVAGAVLAGLLLLGLLTGVVRWFR